MTTQTSLEIPDEKLFIHILENEQAILNEYPNVGLVDYRLKLTHFIAEN